MPDGRCVEFTLKNDEFTDKDFDKTEFKRGLDLMASSKAIPPTYNDEGASLVLSVLKVRCLQSLHHRSGLAQASSSSLFVEGGTKAQLLSCGISTWSYLWLAIGI